MYQYLGDLWLLDLYFRNSEEFHGLRDAISKGLLNEEDSVVKKPRIGVDCDSERAEVLNYLLNMGALGGNILFELL